MMILNPGDSMTGSASKAATLQFSIYGKDGDVWKEITNGFIPMRDAGEEPGVLYVATAITKADLVIIVNIDSGPVTVNLYLLPKDGWRRPLIPFDLSLGAGYSLRTDGDSLEVHDRLGRLLITGRKGDTGVQGSQGFKGDTGTGGGGGTGDVYGFAVVYVPSGEGLFYDDVEYDVRLRTSGAVPGGNVLISQGFREGLDGQLEVWV
jgi:hypothetical protein